MNNNYENEVPELIFGANTASEAEPAAPAEAAGETPVTQEYNFSEEEQKKVDEFAEKIDISDSAEILQYGSAAQQKIAEFSESALSGVKLKDFGQVGDMISGLVSELKGFDDDGEKKGFLGLFKKTKNKLETMKMKYASAEKNVESIAEALENHQLQLLKDVAMLDKMYDRNLSYYKELTMYIAAGKKKLKQEREVTLQEKRKKAEESGLPQDAQEVQDFESFCLRFERKLHDLELTRTICMQMAPQIRLVQNNDTVMTEKIQSVIVSTIPLWKNQMLLSLGIEHSRQAMEAQRSVTDMTNELLKSNADRLKQGTVDISREAERGIVELETLKYTNQQLIDTLNEVQTIQSEGRAKRAEAERELVRIEAELKSNLINKK